jgi:hypothetical protein
MEEEAAPSGNLSLSFDRYLAQSVFHHINTEFPGLQCIHEDPFVFLVHGFLSQEECDALVSKTRRTLQVPSDARSEQLSRADRRTSTTVFPLDEDLQWLRERSAEVTGVRVDQLEPTKLTHYTEGALFSKHTDASFIAEKVNLQTLWQTSANAALIPLPGKPQMQLSFHCAAVAAMGICRTVGWCGRR